MRLLLTFARCYRRHSFIALLALLVGGFAEGLSLSTLLPLLTTAMGGDGIKGAGKAVPQALQSLGIAPTPEALLALVLGGVLLKSALVLVADKRVGYTVAHVATDLRLALMRAVLGVRWEYYLRQRVGGMVNAVTSEALRASYAYLYGITVVTLMIQVVVYMVIALLMFWEATLIAMAAGTLILLVLNRLVHAARSAGGRQTKLLHALLARLTDTLISAKSLKAMGREDLLGPLLEHDTRSLNLALEKEVFSRAALKALQEPMLSTLVILGLFFSLTHFDMPLPEVMVLVFMLGRVMTQLGKVQRQWQMMAGSESAYWALQGAIDEAHAAREISPGCQMPQLDRSIRLDKVSFSYGEQSVLKDLSLEILVGSFTGIVGSSGAGKTTVIDLITGLLQPQQGQVLIDGRPLLDLELRAWRRLIGYVPQEVLLLNDTVVMNVTLGDPALSEADAERALHAAGAWDFVAALPKNMHSIVGERGGSLSGGQRQRIAIARALVHHPRLLILDEATSALDSASEAAILDTLRGLHGQVTILAISHQQGLALAADRVYLMENGGVLYDEDAPGRMFDACCP